MQTIKFLLIILVLCSSVGLSQEEKQTPKFALTASLQSSQLDVLFAPYITQNFVLSLGLGYTYADKSYSDYAVGIIPKFYLSKQELSPYLTARVGGLFHKPFAGKTTTDILAGVGFGGEYFLSEKFSFGIEGQLNSVFLNVSNSSTNMPKAAVNTATVFFGTIYF